MSVEVIGHDAELFRKITCRKCASVLRYLPVDVQKRVTSDYDGGIDSHHYIVCPACRAEVTVKSR